MGKCRRGLLQSVGCATKVTIFTPETFEFEALVVDKGSRGLIVRGRGTGSSNPSRKGASLDTKLVSDVCEGLGALKCGFEGSES